MNGQIKSIQPGTHFSNQSLAVTFAKISKEMDLHEYQAKELMKKFDVPIQDGITCSTVAEAEEAYRFINSQYGSKFAVVKAQIHAGGRGKGLIRGTQQHGVAVGKSADEVKKNCAGYFRWHIGNQANR